MEDIEIKNLINKEINKTKKVIELYSEETKPIAPDCAVDILSRNDALNNMSRVNSLLNQTKAKLSALEFVLTRVGTPEFGKCVRCKKEIPVGRILVRPESLYCIECSQ